jgi:hypothetical protein
MNTTAGNCGCSDSTCCASRHRALKSDARLMALHAVFNGVQHDLGYDDMEMWTCRRCKSTMALKVPAKEAA